MSSTKYQNIPLEHIEAGLVQDNDNQILINSNSNSNSNSSDNSINNIKYEILGQDDDSDTFVYKDGREYLSPNENKILEEIDGEEIVNYDDDDGIELIQHNSSNRDNMEDINLQDTVINTEKSSIFGSTFNFTNSIIGAGNL